MLKQIISNVHSYIIVHTFRYLMICISVMVFSMSCIFLGMSMLHKSKASSCESSLQCKVSLQKISIVSKRENVKKGYPNKQTYEVIDNRGNVHEINTSKFKGIKLTSLDVFVGIKTGTTYYCFMKQYDNSKKIIYCLHVKKSEIEL